MADNEGILSEVEVQQKAQNFLLMKYPESKVTFSGTQLVTKEATPTFQLNGVITMKTRGTLDRFILRSHPNQYFFNIELDARQGTILNYELR